MAAGVLVVTGVSQVAFAGYKAGHDPTRSQAEVLGLRLADVGAPRAADLVRIAGAEGAEVVEAEDGASCELEGAEVSCARLVVRLAGHPTGLMAWSEPDTTLTCWRYTLRNSIHDLEPSRVDCPG